MLDFTFTVYGNGQSLIILHRLSSDLDADLRTAFGANSVMKVLFLHFAVWNEQVTARDTFGLAQSSLLEITI